MASKLFFPEDRGPWKGWDSAAVKRELVSNETIARELVQNSLDAAEDGETEISVDFHLLRVRLEDVPHIDDYRQAYRQARKTLKDQGGPTSKHVTDRIDDALSSEDGTIDCLACVDNGRGLTWSIIKENLYSEGLTNKSTEGRGSVGHGHLTAFAASDLHYVLYAGCSENKGELRNVFGGHAILATQDTRAGKQGTQRSPDGFICDDTVDSEYLNNMEGAGEVPNLLGQFLPNAESENNTGSVVMLCGYTPQDETTNGLSRSQLTLGAVAKNFMVAIQQGILTVRFFSPESQDPEYCDASNIDQALSWLSFQRRRRKNIAGPPGATAYSLFETLKAGASDTGTHVENLGGELEGVQLWLRRLPPEDTRTRIAVFREGMWITDECPRLEKGDFGGNAPFSAVVNLPADTGDDCLTRLVREAEGATHLEILPSEITDKKQKKRLNELLKLLQQKISEIAPEQSSESYIPEEFRLFDMPAEGRALPVPRPRRKPTAPEPKNDEQVVIDMDTDEDDPGEGRGGADTEKKKKIRKRTPRKGNRAGVKTTSRLLPDGKVHIGWQADDKFPYGAADVRIMIPGGSDEASESSITPNYLLLKSVECNGKSWKPEEGSSGVEIRIDDPTAEGQAVVVLADIPSSLDAPLLVAELVHRKKEAE